MTVTTGGLKEQMGIKMRISSRAVRVTKREGSRINLKRIITITLVRFQKVAKVLNLTAKKGNKMIKS